MALVGTRARPELVNALRAFDRVYLALDNDDAGRAATRVLLEALQGRSTAVSLDGVKDVADLAALPGGRCRFARAISAAARTGRAALPLAA